MRALALILAGLPGIAHAADVDFFVPAGSLATGRGTLQGESPFLGPTGFSGGVLAGMSEDPVVRRTTDGTISAAVSTLFPVHLQGSWTQADLLRVDVMLPVYAVVDAPLTGYRGPAVGDLRLQTVVPVVAGTEAFGLSLVPRVEVPTGSEGALVSGGLAAGLVVAAGGTAGPLGWTLAPGIHLSGDRAIEAGGARVGSRAQIVAGAWWSLSDALRLGAEGDLGVGLVAGEGARSTGVAHGFAQVQLPGGLGVTVGGGTGVLAGLGTPRYRVFGALTWTTLRRDRDGDGLADADDACPEDAEDEDAFEDDDGCPDPDNDQDGLVDAVDQCPDVAEDPDGHLDDDGCADDDNDADGLADQVDQCPDLAGPEDFLGCPDQDSDGIPDGADACPATFGVVAFSGCADADGDGIPDPDDACPDQPRPASESIDASDGCPKAVFVTEREIRIEQRVEFENARATLVASSHEVLDQVAAALGAAPHIARMEVQGHTDNVGHAQYNRRLSQSRAEAVVAYLVSKGIGAERLVAQGYGESTPLFTNRTESGREANRRVQFIVLEVAEPTAAAE